MCRRRREGLNPSILLFHRLANHPVLRASNPRTSDPLSKLRKSRSEMGTGFVLGSASSRSSPSSQIPQQPTPEFGYRTVALQKAREAQSKMKRSRTINFQQFYTSASSAGTASVGSGNATSAAAGGYRSVPPSAGLLTTTFFRLLFPTLSLKQSRVKENTILRDFRPLILPPGKSMIFYKRQTEKIELVATPGPHQQRPHLVSVQSALMPNPLLEVD